MFLNDTSAYATHRSAKVASIWSQDQLDAYVEWADKRRISNNAAKSRAVFARHRKLLCLLLEAIRGFFGLLPEESMPSPWNTTHLMDAFRSRTPQNHPSSLPIPSNVMQQPSPISTQHPSVPGPDLGEHSLWIKHSLIPPPLAGSRLHLPTRTQTHHCPRRETKLHWS